MGFLVLVMLLVASSGTEQTPNFGTFAGSWKNTAERPGGPASFVVEQLGGKTFVSIAGAPDKLEATAYIRVPTAGGREGPSAGAIVVQTEERMFIIKPVDGGRLELETYTKLKDPNRRPILVSETFSKAQ